jgi:hypothetical protein
MGLSDQEVGTRGTWVEKRQALLGCLKARGHEVLLASKPSRTSKGLWVPTTPQSKVDLLMIEWSLTNWVFVREDIAETARYVQLHKGPIVFLCDDPEMLGSCFDPRTVSLFAQKNYQRWTLWLDTPFTSAQLSSQLRYPRDAKVVDAPFAALLSPAAKVSVPSIQSIVYSGRGTGGREETLLELQKQLKVQVHGRTKEWKGLTPVGDSPSQSTRANFYAQFVGGLVLADVQHKATGWRTGRAFHAIRAGIPVMVESAHKVLSSTLIDFEEAAEAKELFKRWQNPLLRKADWKKEVKLNFDPSKFNQALESVDL